MEELYRRSPLPVLLFFPVLLAFYALLSDAIARSPGIRWAFLLVLVLLLPRLYVAFGQKSIKRRFPDAHRREWIFGAGACLLSLGIAVINVSAAAVSTPEEMALIAFLSAAINGIAIVSMSPSLGSYLAYMLPNVGSVVLGIVLGPHSSHSATLLVLMLLLMTALAITATSLHAAQRRAILLRLDMDSAHDALMTEVIERLQVENALETRNTQLEAMTQRLMDAQSQLLQSEKMAAVGQLAAGIAHEINNPIAFVRANFLALRGGVANVLSVVDACEGFDHAGEEDKTRERLRRLKESIRFSDVCADIPDMLSESLEGISRVEKIVRDLTEFSRVDRKEDWERYDIHKCIESALNVAAHELKYKATIVRAYGPLPDVWCLPFQMNQVFLNLLINAAQSFEARGTIEIRTHAAGQHVFVVIADDGAGIPAEHLPRIFEPFFTTKPLGIGTGLGLSVSYGIVRKHGGELAVTSELGHGTTFTVTLPVTDR
ncbi:MAG: ATP-binding protein [Tahibacter sp.]